MARAASAVSAPGGPWPPPAEAEPSETGRRWRTLSYVFLVLLVLRIVLVVLRVVQAVVSLAELNRPDVTGAEAAPPQLVRAGTRGLVPRINRLARRQQREMPGARPAVIREGVQTGVARQVAGLQGDGAPGRITDQVMAQRGDRATTLIGNRVRGRTNIVGEDGVRYPHGPAAHVADGPTPPLSGAIAGNRTVNECAGCRS